MPIKVAFIGAGSIGFTRQLTRDILAVPELRDARFALHDINARNLRMVAQLVQRDIAHNKLPARVTTHKERKAALDGAHYVINCTRIGGLEAFRSDIDIPLKYGVDQCVGDTLCVGGILYGQRNIPQVLDFCADIRNAAADDALFLNYANPMAMNTWAALEHGGVQALGLCHGVQGGHWQIAQAIELLVNKGKKPGSRGFKPVAMQDVDIIAAGINHQTWYVQVLFEGEDWTGRRLEGFEEHPDFSRQEKVRIDMLRRFGLYSTESNGHLSEYVPWYRKRPRDIPKWISLDFWILGEAGGYLRMCTEGRSWSETDLPNWLKETPPDLANGYQRSLEHGSFIIEGLETGRHHRGHFNVRNNGAITNLPDDCIVEIPGHVDGNGIAMTRVGALPLGCAAVCNASVSVQRLAVEAAVRGDVALLEQAATMDPLTGAVCDPHEINQMIDEMLVAQAKWLPQYRGEIAGARRRLEGAKALGTSKSRGAARVKTKSVGEMRKDAARARRMASATDKGNAAREQRAAMRISARLRPPRAARRAARRATGPRAGSSAPRSSSPRYRRPCRGPRTCG